MPTNQQPQPWSEQAPVGAPVFDPTKPYEAPESSSVPPPITSPPANPLANAPDKPAPSMWGNNGAAKAASAAYIGDSVLKGIMKGRQAKQEQDTYKLNRLMQGLQYAAQTSGDAYVSLIKNGADPKSPEAQAALAGADAARQQMLTMYSNYVEGQDKGKKGKKSGNAKGGDQAGANGGQPSQQEIAVMLTSPDPKEKVKGIFLMTSHATPWYRIAGRYYASPEYKRAKQNAAGEQQLAGITTASKLDVATLEKAEREGTINADDKKKLDAYRNQATAGEEGKESAQVRGMRSGLKAAGLDDDTIKKVITSHYGGAGMRGTSVQQKYADAVQDAVDNGRDPATDPAAQQLAKAIAAEHPPAERAATLKLPDGKQAAGKVSHEGDLLLADGSKAPAGTMLYQQPNYASVIGQVQETKTQTVIDDRGIPTIMRWNPITRNYDIPVGSSASGAYGHEEVQAGAVSRAGGDLIKDIQANREQLGTLAAWVKKHGINTPIGDPKLAGLQSELKTFAALQPAMHGFRSRSAQEAFENIIGDLQKNPDATIASIQGIMKTAGAINPNLGKGGAGDTGGDSAKRKRNPSKPADPNDPLGIR